MTTLTICLVILAAYVVTYSAASKPLEQAAFDLEPQALHNAVWEALHNIKDTVPSPPSSTTSPHDEPILDALFTSAQATASFSPLACKQISEKNFSSKCNAKMSVEMCVAAFKLQWRCWIRGDGNRVGYSGYQQSMQGAVNHCVQEWASRYPDCMGP